MKERKAGWDVPWADKVGVYADPPKLHSTKLFVELGCRFDEP
jgi:hypothetical protein